VYIFIFLRRVEPLLWNDSEVSKYTRAVSRQRLGKHIPATTDTNATMVWQLRNSVFCGPPAAVATQRRSKHISAAMNPDTIEELCFLCSPCQGVIREARFRSQWFDRRWREAYEVGVKWLRVSCKSAQLKVLLWTQDFVWYLESAIQWDCYSSCVKIRC
jgi:hypothetical protein